MKALAGIAESLASANLMLVQPHGRAGSVFLQSLFDGHPSVITLPHFGPMYRELPAETTDLPAALDAFIAAHPHLFDSSHGYFGKGSETVSGAFGDAFDEHLKVDPRTFKEICQAMLAVSTVSRKTLFKAIHFAYAAAAGRRDPTPVKYILCHPHYYPECDLLLADFPDLFYLAMTRDPRQDWASWRHVEALRKGVPVALLPPSVMLWSAEEYSRNVMNLARFLAAHRPSHVRILDLERFHELNVTGMKALCRWLGIEFDDCLLRSTFNGRPWAGNAADRRPVTGFRPPRPNDAWKKTLPADEGRLLSQVLGRSIKWLHYDDDEADRSAWTFVRFLPQVVRTARPHHAQPRPGDPPLPIGDRITQPIWALRAWLRGALILAAMRRQQHAIPGAPAPAELFL